MRNQEKLSASVPSRSKMTSAPQAQKRQVLACLFGTEGDVPRSMKMGTIASPWCYEVLTCSSLRSQKVRRLAISLYIVQSISPRRIEKPGSAGVVSTSCGPCSVIEDQPSPLGPLCIHVERVFASITQNSFTPWRA